MKEAENLCTAGTIDLMKVVVGKSIWRVAIFSDLEERSLTENEKMGESVED